MDQHRQLGVITTDPVEAPLHFTFVIAVVAVIAAG